MSNWKEYTNDADPAHSAAEKGDLEAVEAYLSGEGADYLKRVYDRELHIDSTVTEEGNRGGWTLLFCAVVSGDPDIVRYLIENGADVGITDVYNQTCLAYAKGATVRSIIKSEQTKREKRAEHWRCLALAWQCINNHEAKRKTLDGLLLRMVQERYTQEQRTATETEMDRKRLEGALELEESDTVRPFSAGLRDPLADDPGSPGSETTPESTMEKLQKSIDYTHQKCVEELDAVTEHVVQATEAAEYFERLQVAYAGRPLEGEERDKATSIFISVCGDEAAVAGPEQLAEIAELVRHPKTAHRPEQYWSEERSLKLVVKFGGIEDDPVMYLPEFLNAFVAFSMLVSAAAANVVADSMLEAQAAFELAAAEQALFCRKFVDAREALERAEHFFANVSNAVMVRGADGQPRAKERAEVTELAAKAEEVEGQSQRRLLMETNLHNARLALEDYEVKSTSFFKREEALGRLEEARGFVEEAKGHLEHSCAGPEVRADVVRMLFSRACAQHGGAERLPGDAVGDLLAQLNARPSEEAMGEVGGGGEGDGVPLEAFVAQYHKQHAALWRRRAGEEVERVRQRVVLYSKHAQSYARGRAEYEAGLEEFEDERYAAAQRLALEADELFEESKSKDYRMLCREFAKRSEEAHVRMLRQKAYASLLQADALRQELVFKAARDAVGEARAALCKTGRAEDFAPLDAALHRIDAHEQQDSEDEFLPRMRAVLGPADALLLKRDYRGGLELYQQCVNRGEDFLDDFPRSAHVQRLQARVQARCCLSLAAVGTTSGSVTWFEKALAHARECRALAPEWKEGLLLEGMSLAGAGRLGEATATLAKGLREVRGGGGCHRRMAMLYVLATGKGIPSPEEEAEAEEEEEEEEEEEGGREGREEEGARGDAGSEGSEPRVEQG